MICPECKQETSTNDKCEKCGVNFNINSERDTGKKMLPKPLRVLVVIILLLIPTTILVLNIIHISTLSSIYLKIPRYSIPQLFLSPIFILAILIGGIKWIKK